MELNYGQLPELLQDPNVQFERVEVTPHIITGKFVRPNHGPVSFVTQRGGLQQDPNLVTLLTRKVGSGLKGESDSENIKLVYALLGPPLTFLILALGFVWVLRRMGGPGLFTFGRSPATRYAALHRPTSFADVAGADEAVEDFREIVDFLKDPAKYQAVGGRIPKGALLVGPPGTGKTLLARAVAGEAHVPFFSLSGSSFVEMFVGVGAARVRDVFAQARRQAPCIVFIDELDALGKARGGSPGGAHDEREQTLNQLLVEMDGFDGGQSIIIMAATNRPEMLDPALLRPGRFDRTVVLDRPDINGREAILKVHAAHVRLAADVKLREIAALTPGFVGADLANLINEAALGAARKGRREVSRSDLENALERGMAGLERKRRIMRPEEKERVAYHETGHALVACLLPGADPVHKVSIIPRGLAALGYTLQRPEEDRYLIARSELMGQIKVLLGGTIAEELIYCEPSTGAQNDLERASRIARGMVKQFGMSRLGRVSYQDQNSSLVLGTQTSSIAEREYSEQTAREIDSEVARILDEAAADVRRLLEEWRPAFEAAASSLVEKEVLDGAEFREILHGYAPARTHAACSSEVWP
jgi:cell division protease FtsH